MDYVLPSILIVWGLVCLALPSLPLKVMERSMSNRWLFGRSYEVFVDGRSGMDASTQIRLIASVLVVIGILGLAS